LAEFESPCIKSGFTKDNAELGFITPHGSKGAQGWRAMTEHKDGTQDGVQAATGKDVEGLGGTTREIFTLTKKRDKY
jgi:hypothetical protein